MKNKLLFIAVGLALNLGAQTPLSSSNCSLTLSVSNEEDGTNGVAVAYNPTNNLYYTIFAGNAEYPIETHTTSGASINSQDANFDCRGLWYNPTTKCLEGISYGNTGSMKFLLDGTGKIMGTKETTFSYGMEAQTVAVYAEKKKALMFVEGITVSFFKPGKAKAKTLTLDFPSDLNLNTNGAAYTGVKNYEIAIMEAGVNVVHLFSAKTGKETGQVKLDTKDMELPSFFNASYANNLFFVFDVNARTWSGYKLF
jgi:hypothetical protein